MIHTLYIVYMLLCTYLLRNVSLASLFANEEYVIADHNYYLLRNVSLESLFANEVCVFGDIFANDVCHSTIN